MHQYNLHGQGDFCLPICLPYWMEMMLLKNKRKKQNYNTWGTFLPDNLTTVSSVLTWELWCLISLLPSSFHEDTLPFRRWNAATKGSVQIWPPWSLDWFQWLPISVFLTFVLLPMGYWPWRHHNSQQTWFCFHASQRVQIPPHNCQELGFMSLKPRGPGRTTMAQVYWSRSPWWYFSTWGTFPSGRATGPEYWCSLDSFPFQLLGPS